MKKEIIRLDEEEIRSIVESVCNELLKEEATDEGKLGKALGTAALGGALLFGRPQQANAQTHPTDTTSQQTSANVSRQSDDRTLNLGEYSDTVKRVQADTIMLQQKVQGEKLADRISREVKGEHSLGYDDISAEYELIYQSNVDAKTMYNRLMAFIHNQKDVSASEIDGKYQITVRDEQIYSRKTRDLIVYRIFLKDGKFKITANVSSQFAYSLYGVNNKLAIDVVTMPKLVMSVWAAKMIEGPTHEFDF